MTTCGDCGHPYDWHGDRAVSACLGDAPEVWPPSRTLAGGVYLIDPICWCRGWKGISDNASIAAVTALDAVGAA